MIAGELMGMRLETESLILREYRPDDFEALYEIFSDSETMKYYPHPFSKDETRQWIQRNIDRYKEYGFGLWAVELKETGQLIGDCGITMQLIHGKLLPEIGYHINKKYQNQGFATQAAIACKQYAFETLKFDKVYSYMKYTNYASERVAIKNGMRLVEEYDDPVNIRTKVYAISRLEYENQKKLETLGETK